MFVAAAGETFWKGGFDSFFLVSMGIFYNIPRFPLQKAYICIFLLFNILQKHEFLKKYGVEILISCATVSIQTNGYFEKPYNKPGMTISFIFRETDLTLNR